MRGFSRNARRSGRQRGMSLMEVTVALGATTIVLLIVMGMIEEATRVTLFVESHNDLTTLTQRPLNLIQRDVLQERYVFEEDAMGTDYRTNIEAQLLVNPVSPPVISTSLLPVVDVAGTLGPDGAVRRTGNALLVARQLTPVSISLAADGTDPATYPAVNFIADRYQFEYFYLSPISGQQFMNGDHLLDLIRFKSVAYCDYFQLVNSVGTLSSSQRTQLAGKLIDPAQFNLPIAWNPGQKLKRAGTDRGAFFTVPADLNFTPVLGQASPTITRSSVTSMLPELKSGHIAGKMRYTIAYLVGSSPGALMNGVSNRNVVPLYAQPGTLPNDCGFEIKIAGAPGSRQALARLVLYAQYGAKNTVDSQEASVISSFTR